MGSEVKRGSLLFGGQAIAVGFLTEF